LSASEDAEILFSIGTLIAEISSDRYKRRK
jgi:hypothetical protein